MVNLRKEVLLLGEMQRRYREKMSIPRAGEQEQVNLADISLKRCHVTMNSGEDFMPDQYLTFIMN